MDSVTSNVVANTKLLPSHPGHLACGVPDCRYLSGLERTERNTGDCGCGISAKAGHRKFNAARPCATEGVPFRPTEAGIEPNGRQLVRPIKCPRYETSARLVTEQRLVEQRSTSIGIRPGAVRAARCLSSTTRALILISRARLVRRRCHAPRRLFRQRGDLADAA